MSQSMTTLSNLRSMRASPVSIMLPLWKYSRRVSRQGSFPTAMVWKLYPRCLLPGRKSPGFSTKITSSCSSILGAHSPNNANSSASPSLAHLVRATRTHWCLPPLLPLPLSSQSQPMPNWAKLVTANVIAVAGKGIGHKTAPRKARVPDVVVYCSNTARSEQLTCQNHSLKKGSMMMKRERAR
jgi:hypothetical protein